MAEKISFYFDEHLPRSAAVQLIQHGFNVVMAVDVAMIDKDDDAEHLPYATEHSHVMVTFDRGFAGRTMKRGDQLVWCVFQALKGMLAMSLTR